MFNFPAVWIETIGICEDCGRVQSFQEIIANNEQSKMPMICVRCGQKLFFDDFGFFAFRSGSEYRFLKTVWVGPDLRFTHKRPNNNFFSRCHRVVLTPGEASLSDNINLPDWLPRILNRRRSSG
jgi:hypothetical protein